jgi:hypothetical protein
MLFTSIHTYYFQARKEELKNRLIGKHVKIHNIDFEVFEKDNSLSIIPHAEQEESIKTLPITSIVLNEEGDRTKAVVTSRMRKLDTGGPLLLLIFCGFMVLAAIVLLKMAGEPIVAYSLLGITVLMLTLFGIRMQTGYFDYVHKVRDYIKTKAGPLSNGSGVPLAGM